MVLPGRRCGGSRAALWALNIYEMSIPSRNINGVSCQGTFYGCDGYGEHGWYADRGAGVGPGTRFATVLNKSLHFFIFNLLSEWRDTFIEQH